MASPLYDALDRAVKALKARPHLPHPISISQTLDGLWVTPWISCAPVTGLLAWHAALNDASREVEAGQVADMRYWKITVRGFLDDVPVIAQVTTYRDPGVTRGPISEAALKRVAEMEDPLDMKDPDG